MNINKPELKEALRDHYVTVRTTPSASTPHVRINNDKVKVRK